MAKKLKEKQETGKEEEEEGEGKPVEMIINKKYRIGSQEENFRNFWKDSFHTPFK